MMFYYAVSNFLIVTEKILSLILHLIGGKGKVHTCPVYNLLLVNCMGIILLTENIEQRKPLFQKFLRGTDSQQQISFMDFPIH
jgi:hypothetical protein